jgi:uncharacterized membrane protein
MKLFSERRSYAWFRWGVWLKLLISVGEIALGVALAFWSYETLKHIVLFFVGSEIAETPRDLFWEYAVRGFRNFAAAPESFWAFLFISHGLVKMFLSWGLWKDKLWAFPVSAAVFAGFVVYQIYQLTYLNSIFLWLMTIFDIALIALILNEYRHRRRRTLGYGQI